MNLSFFERMREKPKPVRVQFSFLAALGVAGVVGLLWVAALPVRLSAPQNDVSRGAASSFFGSARENVSQLIGASENTPAVRSEAVGSTPPGSSTYAPGAPEEDANTYASSQAENSAVSIQKREVLIATTSSNMPR